MKNLRLFLLAGWLVVLTLPGAAMADQTSDKLDDLFGRLKVSTNAFEAAAIGGSQASACGPAAAVVADFQEQLVDAFCERDIDDVLSPLATAQGVVGVDVLAVGPDFEAVVAAEFASGGLRP